MPKFTSKIIPSSSLASAAPFDDLTVDEKLSLLKSEFDQVTSECIEDALKSFGHDYETTRSVIQELFPRPQHSTSASTSSASGNLADDADYFAEPNSVFNGSDLMMEISPTFFARLHAQFDGTELTDYECLPSIAKDFETQGSMLLPLDAAAAKAIYKSVLQFVRRSNVALEQEDEGLSDVFELSRDPVSSVSAGSLRSPVVSVDAGNLKEIMELEAALKASREEYVSGLSKMMKRGANDAAISQELCLEKKRMFIVEKFPGINELQLNNLFEINCYNLNETIKDIEAIYNFKLPNCYRHSLYCEIVKRTNSDSGIATESTVSDEEDDEEDDSRDVIISNDKEFSSKVQNLFEERKMARVRIAHLRSKSAHFNFRKQPHAALLYQQEIAKCNLQMKQISDNIIQTYVSYSHPSNVVDLHFLIMKEVNSIVPEMLRRKQTTLSSSGVKKLKFKIITGIGSSMNGSGLIRQYLLRLLTKNNIKFETDGPGAFIVNLSIKSLINF